MERRSGSIAAARADQGRGLPLDTSFGSGGIIREFASGFTRRSAPLLPASGGVVLAGFAGPGDTNFAVAKFIPDGRPDRTFGTDGQVVLRTPATADLSPVRLAVQPDGRILVATLLPQTPLGFQWSLVRLRSDGAPDASFNGDGAVEVSFPGTKAAPSLAGVLVADDGRILLIGSRSGSMLAARYHPNGQIDRGFGVEGKLVAALPGVAAHLAAAVLDGRGNIVVSGSSSRFDSRGDVLIARFRPNGSGDPSFGFDGTSIVDFGGGSDAGSKLRLLADGRILVAGTATRSLESMLTQPALLRLHPDGELDSTFGDGGLVRVETGKEPGSDRLSALDLISDGRIAIAGHYEVDPIRAVDHPYFRVPQAFVALRRADGTPDHIFDGDDGVVFLGDGFLSNYVHAVAQGGDKLLVFAGMAAIRLATTAPRIPTVQMTIGASPNPAGPGPLQFQVTITNAGPSANGGILRLRASKKVSVVRSTAMKPTVDANGVDVVSKVPAVPPGGTATLVLRTTASGFEEGISLGGSMESTHADGKPIASSSSIMVSTGRLATI